MRGAVLHKMMLEFVKERMLRSTYGLVIGALFRPGHDAPWREYIDYDGNRRCSSMLWLARKVFFTTWVYALIGRDRKWRTDLCSSSDRLVHFLSLNIHDPVPYIVIRRFMAVTKTFYRNMMMTLGVFSFLLSR